MLEFVACIFIVVGIIFTTGSFNIRPETSIHQIYQQLCILTGVVIMGVGFIMLTIRSIKVKVGNSDVVELPVKTMEEAKEEFLKKRQEEEEGNLKI